MGEPPPSSLAMADTLLDRDTNCSDTRVTQPSESSCSDTVLYEPQCAPAPSSGSDNFPLTHLSEPHGAQALHSDDDLVPLSQLAHDTHACNHVDSRGDASRQASLAPQVCLLWLLVWIGNPIMWTGISTTTCTVSTLRCTHAQWRKQGRTLAALCSCHHIQLNHVCPRSRRLLHPLRGVRVGEAGHPGPPVGRLIAQTQQTLLDAFSQSGSSRQRESMDAPAEDAASSNTSDAGPAAELQPLPDTFEVQLLHAGSDTTLSVHARPGDRWQWCLMSQPMLLSQFARSPATGLAQFLAKH
eukprot:5235624-Amphidinium_carterae.1